MAHHSIVCRNYEREPQGEIGGTNHDMASTSLLAVRLSECSVHFTGGTSSNPAVTPSATEKFEDVTVNVNVSGCVTDPQIPFSSVPGLPQDASLSQPVWLFDRQSLNLALQLAASLSSMRGLNGGLNPLGKLRFVAGVDRFRILGGDETQDRGTALTVSQYLTEDV